MRPGPGQWILWWEAKKLPRFVQLVRRRPGFPRFDHAVWSGFWAVVGWTICFSGDILARPAPSSSTDVEKGRLTVSHLFVG